jgi:quercetin dioxygenase-like cupin family protein
MAGLERKRFDSPDETRTSAGGKGRVDVVTVGQFQIGRGTFEPGWRWSEHVRPSSSAESCHAVHAGCILQGRMAVRTDAGEEMEYEPGDAFYIPGGHNLWVVGDEPCIMIDITGNAHV